MKTLERKDSISPENTFSPNIAGLIFVITGIIGSIASFLLLYERIMLWNNADHSTACDVNPWISCGQVMESWQAATFGFPNVFIGVVAFPILIFAGITMLIIGKHLAQNKIWWAGLTAGAVFSLGFITWLWYSAVFTIGVLCPYCMIVWAAVIPFSVFVFSYLISNNVFNANIGNKTASFIKNWWWIITILVYCAVIVSVLIMFPHAFSF